MEQPFGEDKIRPRALNVVWAPFASRFRTVHNAVGQNIPPGAGYTIVEFPGEIFDGLGEYDPILFQFVPAATGYYLFTARVTYDTIPANTLSGAYLFQTASIRDVSVIRHNSAEPHSHHLSCVTFCVVGEVINVRTNHGHVLAQTLTGASPWCNFTGHRLS